MNIDHERAKHADEYSQRQCETPVPKTTFKQYRSVVLKSVAQIRQEGLLQLAAFWFSKGDEECVVFRDLMEWLGKNERTAGLFPADRRVPTIPNDEMKERTSELVRPLVGRNSMEIALLEDEAEHFLGWLKRLTEGRHKELKEKERQKQEVVQQDVDNTAHPAGV